MKPRPPGVYRAVRGKLVSVDDNVPVLVAGKYHHPLNADAVRDGTYQEPLKPGRGRPRKNPTIKKAKREKQNEPEKLPERGVHLILFPWFWNWLTNRRQDLVAQWSALADRRQYFIQLSHAVCSTGFDRASLAECESKAPELTKAAMPTLIKRWKKVTREDYAAACSSPSYGTAKNPRKMSPRERDRRSKVRRAAELFDAATE